MSRLDDTGTPSTDMIVSEDPDSNGHSQALWIGVRPVYHGNDRSKDPVIQVSYQSEHLGASLVGPVFIDVETWKKLKKSVDRRIKYHRLGRIRLW